MNGNTRFFHTYFLVGRRNHAMLRTETNVIPTLRKFRLLILSTGDTMMNKIKQTIGPQGACHLVWGGWREQEPYTGQHPVKGNPGWLGAPGGGLQRADINS